MARSSGRGSILALLLAIVALALAAALPLTLPATPALARRGPLADGLGRPRGLRGAGAAGEDPVGSELQSALGCCRPYWH